MTLTLQPICVSSARGEDSFLALKDDCLVAVLVRLSAQYGDDSGKWFFEAGFGSLDGPDHPIFLSLDEATDYVRGRLALAGTGCPAWPHKSGDDVFRRLP